MMNYPWLLLLLLNPVFSQTTDKYSDEDRPYKFGFNIQGYQHRQEEKDEKGLIKGEYGFITADGYYRVTVYATDENGDFKIISMKNYYVGFPPEDPSTTPEPPSHRSANARPPISNPSFSSQAGPTGRALAGDDRSAKPLVPPQGQVACSDCFIPTTTTRTNQANLIANTGDFRSGRKEGGTFETGISPGRGFGQGPAGGQISQFPQGSPRANVQGPSGGQVSRFPQESPRSNQGSAEGQSPLFPQVTPQQLSGGFISGGQSPFEGDNQNRNLGGQGFKSRSGTPISGNSGFSKGRDHFVQKNQLDDTPRRRPKVGEIRDGLPPGVSLNDIKDLLYTFNYTVGFHGHHEDGFRNGDKEGDYFFDGRDGVERKVEYIANEFGYQPNITFIDLPENDVRRPKEETEKEYGLKGYEFKWFYRK